MQNIHNEKFADLPSFRVVDSDHTPSWKVGEKGHANLQIVVHPEVKWLSICLSEHGPKTSRQTMLTLKPDIAQKLFNELKAIYEG